MEIDYQIIIVQETINDSLISIKQFADSAARLMVPEAMFVFAISPFISA